MRTSLAARWAEYQRIIWQIAPLMTALALLTVAAMRLFFTWANAGPDHLDPFTHHPLGHDYLSLWSAGHLAASGHAAEVYDAAAIAEAHKAGVAGNTFLTLFHYPPSFLLLLAPLARLPYLASYWVFELATAALFLAVLYRLRPQPSTLLFGLAAPACWLNMLSGQNGFLTASLAGLGLLWLTARPKLAGVAFGLLTYKPQLALCLPIALLAGRHGRTLIAAGLTCGGLLALAWIAFGSEVFGAFVHNLPMPVKVLEEGRIPLDRMTSAFTLVRSLGGSVLHAYSAQALTAFIGLAVLVVLWSHKAASAGVRGAALILAMLLITPHVFHYDQTLLLIALALWLREAEATRWLRGERVLLFAAYLSPYFLLQETPFVMLALCVLLLQRARLGLKGIEQL